MFGFSTEVLLCSLFSLFSAVYSIYFYATKDDFLRDFTSLSNVLLLLSQTQRGKPRKKRKSKASKKRRKARSLKRASAAEAAFTDGEETRIISEGESYSSSYSSSSSYSDSYSDDDSRPSAAQKDAPSPTARVRLFERQKEASRNKRKAEGTPQKKKRKRESAKGGVFESPDYKMKSKKKEKKLFSASESDSNSSDDFGSFVVMRAAQGIAGRLLSLFQNTGREAVQRGGRKIHDKFHSRITKLHGKMFDEDEFSPNRGPFGCDRRHPPSIIGRIGCMKNLILAFKY